MASLTSPRRTLSIDLMACLDQEEMTDMYLIGTDGVEVPAFRAILACRSDVLRNMLVGKFEESTSKVVELRYSSNVLRAAVEFCITDDVKQFDGRFDESAARGVVQLIACAHFLNMPLLEEKARTLTKTLLEGHISLACNVFDEAALFGEPTESVKLDAITAIRKFPIDSLLSNLGILALRPETLSELISDDGMMCEEIVLFRALYVWATAETEYDGSFSWGTDEDRASIAKKLAIDHIRLSSIGPTDLAGIVSKSHLVDEILIYEAFKAQALLAEKETDLPFSKRRNVEKIPGITVSGAGADIVNGFYNKDGDWKGYPKFTKKCIWKGKSGSFCIYNNVGGSWCIGIVGEDGVIGKPDNDFYQGDDQEKVQIDEWGLSILGFNPNPVCNESWEDY